MIRSDLYVQRFPIELSSTRTSIWLIGSHRDLCSTNSSVCCLSLMQSLITSYKEPLIWGSLQYRPWTIVLKIRFQLLKMSFQSLTLTDWKEEPTLSHHHDILTGIQHYLHWNRSVIIVWGEYVIVTLLQYLISLDSWVYYHT